LCSFSIAKSDQIGLEVSLLPDEEKMKMSRCRHGLSVQQLDDRVVPAGNVAVLVSEGVLYFQGDDASNAVWVQATGQNQVTILPTDGTTTINGQSTPVTISGVTRGLYAKMGGGDDSLNIDGVSWDVALFVDMGDGNNALALSNCYLPRGATLVTGSGDDYVSIGGSDIRGTTFISTGDGNDTVNLGWTRFDSLVLDGGAGTNQVGAPSVDLDHSPQVTNFTVSPTLIPLPTPAPAPTAQDDSLTVSAGSSATVDVAANDSASQSSLDLTSVTLVTQPTLGTVTVNGDGTVTYTSTGTTAGTDSFQYTIKNAAGVVSNIATVSVTITSADTTAPTVTVSSTASNPTETSPIPVTVTFSESVTGFTAAGVSATNGTVSNFAIVSASTYTFDVTPITQGDVTISIAANVARDAGGNANVASASLTRTFDGTVSGSSGMSATMPDVNAAEWQTQANGLKIWDVQTGSGTAVTSGSTVEVYYTGWLASDGTEFDSNRTGSSPATFQLGNLIEGWQEGLVGMQAGGIRRLFVPAALGYGSSGSGSIPSNADLVFEIKLIAVT
jgi:hypothetical protein